MDTLSPVLFNLANMTLGDSYRKRFKYPCLAIQVVLFGEDKETIEINTTTLMKAGIELGLNINSGEKI